jgi:hypothetical protein
LRNGEALWYEPSAIVYHPVPPERLNKRYFLQWWFDKGRADIREGYGDAETRLRLAGIPLYLLRRMVVRTLHWLSTFNVAHRFDRRLEVWYVAGQIVEAWRRRPAQSAA